MSEARRGIAAYERELRQSRQAARELVALAVPATVVRSALELDADLELAKAQPGDRQVGLDARAPERDSRAARKLEAAAAPRRRGLGGAGIEQAMADQGVGDEMIEDLLEALEPAQRPRHAGERLVVVSGARAQVIEAQERGPHVPLQVGLARDFERSFEVRARPRIIGQPHVAGQRVPDHHQVLALVALVADAPRQLQRALVARDRGRRLVIVVVRLAAPVIGLHRDQVREAEALADPDCLGVKPDGLAVAAVAPRDRAQGVERIGGGALGEREKARDAVIQLGMAYRRADDYERATECLTQALAESRAMRDERHAADTLYHLGTVAWSNSRNREAIGFHAEAVGICERLGLADLVAVQAYHGRGEAHYNNAER